jgi:hypothetical protein
MRLSPAAAVYALLAFGLLAACGRDARPLDGSGTTAYSARLLMASPPAVEFTQIGAVEADSRGRVYVTDLPNTLRVLDPAGNQIRTIGRAGGGPGEFNRISELQLLRGDTLMVFDAYLGRATFYGLDQDKPGRMHNVQSGPSEHAVRLFRFDDGTFIGHFRGIMGPDYQDPTTRREFLRILDTGGGLTGTALTVRPPDVFSLRDGEGMTYGFPRFAPRMLVHFGRDRIYTLWTDSAALRVFDREGRFLSTIELRVPASRTPISSAMYDTVAAGIGSPAIRSTVRSLIESRWRSWPLIEGFLLDDRNGIWVKPTSRAGPNRWYRLASDGTLVGHIALPPNATPRLVKDGRIHCVMTDENDVQTIATYAIVSSPPTSGEQR